jgi:hypothetical protein
MGTNDKDDFNEPPVDPSFFSGRIQGVIRFFIPLGKTVVSGQLSAGRSFHSPLIRGWPKIDIGNYFYGFPNRSVRYDCGRKYFALSPTIQKFRTFSKK